MDDGLGPNDNHWSKLGEKNVINLCLFCVRWNVCTGKLSGLYYFNQNGF